jgi:tetratricopeptide (TPR) repeat protein
MFKKVFGLIIILVMSVLAASPKIYAQAQANENLTSGYMLFLDRLSSDPNTPVELNQANAYLRRGAVNEALKIYEKILVPLNADLDHADFSPPARQLPLDKKAQLYLSARLGYANALMKTGKDKLALRNYDEAVKIKPEIIKYYLKLGSGMLRTGRIDTAEMVLKRYLLADPDNASANAGLGTVNFTRKNYNLSLEYFKRAKAADPNDSAIRHSIAAVMIKLDQRDKAIEHLRTAIEINPKNYAARVMLAANYKALDQPVKAIEQYQRVLSLDPNIPAAAYNIGVLKLNERYEDYYEPYEAYQHLLRACELTDFSRPDYLDTLSVAAYLTERYARAIEYANLSLAIHRAAGNSKAVAKTKDRIEFYEKAILLSESTDTSDPNSVIDDIQDVNVIYDQLD